MFENYSTRYRPGLELVLHNVNFEIMAGERVSCFNNVMILNGNRVSLNLFLVLTISTKINMYLPIF